MVPKKPWLCFGLRTFKEKYEKLRTSLMRHGADVLRIQAYYASQNKFTTTAYGVYGSLRANLQDLMDHTAKRLLESLPENEVEILPEKLTLISKWGCDGKRL
ncbi:hypothetical protein EVAR_91357_1 [Eumeta japonica]|uniref:Uncharacterized protein n=1 Tax=Eumeta variegata TaxID=151549 RepID=A0A4C1TU80_EUMVA|nr:hypothetical protein EVAR_91357_1 [Eumeta japonica]